MIHYLVLAPDVPCPREICGLAAAPTVANLNEADLNAGQCSRSQLRLNRKAQNVTKTEQRAWTALLRRLCARHRVQNVHATETTALRCQTSGYLNMAEPQPVQLVYEGPDIMGFMTVGDLVTALSAFVNMFEEIMAKPRELEQHARIASLENGAARMLIDLADCSAIPTCNIKPSIIDLARIIGAKKHLAGLDPLLARVEEGPGSIIVLNGDGCRYEMTANQFALLKSRILDVDLEKITDVLRAGKVDSVALKLGEADAEKITAQDRRLFESAGATLRTTHDEIWIEGTLHSLSKHGFRGIFVTTRGKRVGYRYLGTDPKALFHAFAHAGHVRVRCTVQASASRSVFLSIFEVRLVRTSL